MVEDLYDKSKHYNVQFRVGGLVNRVTARDLCALSFQDIAWVWVVEERRHATPEEIWKLCKPA
jgi:hypothetical protein